MPIPNVITDLSATAASNSPTGNENPIEGDNHLRTAYAFIRQIYDGSTGIAYPTLANLANTSNAALGSALVGVNATLNYAAGTVGAKFIDVSPADYPWLAKFDDATDDSAAIQACIDWVSLRGGGRISFPAGTALCASPITFKNNIDYVGQGATVFTGGTTLHSTSTTDAFQILNPINSSTAAFINIRGIHFYAFSLATANACTFYDRGSSLLTIKECAFRSNKVCLALDQTELCSIEGNYFGGGSNSDSTGIWLINGADKAVGASTYFTNRITIYSNQFNNGAFGTAIYDDGGVTHAFRDNNFNGWSSHIIAIGVNSIVIEGGEYEINAAQSIIFGVTKRGGAAGGKTNVARVSDTFHYNTASQPAIATVAGALGSIRITDNHYNLPGTVYTGMTLPDEVIAQGNRQVGAGDGLTLINNYYPEQTHTPGWAAAVGTPAIGNGVLSARYTRAGKQVKWNLRLEIGSTTTFGTSGAWSFFVPIAAPANAFDCGAAVVLKNGTSYYSATARMNSTGTSVTVYITNGTGAVGVTNPGLAAGPPADFIDAQLTYTAAAWI